MADADAIKQLLEAMRLPSEDIADHFQNFFVAEAEGVIVGVGGIEDCGEGIGLLRSFGVAREYRNQGIGQKIYDDIVEHSRRLGISSLYLLTTTARGYFGKLGFAPVDREKAPPSLQHTHQFSVSCPSSAVLMHRSLL
jgi:amino-acid N-acetyltransferase